MLDYLQYVRLQFPEIDASLEDLERRLTVLRGRDRRTASTSASKRLRSCQAYNFAPEDDIRLLAAGSLEEYRSAVDAIASETGWPKRAIRRRAQELNLPYSQESWRQTWRKTRRGKLTAMIDSSQVIVFDLTRKTEIGSLKAVRHVIYRDTELVARLYEDSYTLTDVAEGLCLSKMTLRRFIQSGDLPVLRFSRNGKAFIAGDDVYNFVSKNPRAINWDQAFKKSPWLQCLLIDQRKRQLSDLFRKTPKTVTAWIENGELRLGANAATVSEILSDVSVYQFLVDHEHCLDWNRCVESSPEWFARYTNWKDEEWRKKATAGGGHRVNSSAPETGPGRSVSRHIDPARSFGQKAWREKNPDASPIPRSFRATGRQRSLERASGS